MTIWDEIADQIAADFQTQEVPYQRGLITAAKSTDAILALIRQRIEKVRAVNPGRGIAFGSRYHAWNDACDTILKELE